VPTDRLVRKEGGQALYAQGRHFVGFEQRDNAPSTPLKRAGYIAI